MFVDESGDPGYPSTGGWRAFGGSKHYVRVGVIIHGWKWKTWNRRLENFKTTNGLLSTDEIRASNIRQGNKAFIGWNPNRRNKFLVDLATLVGANADITLIGIDIDKTRVDIRQATKYVRPEIRSLELLLERYNMFLNNAPDRSGIVVLDPTKENKDDDLRHYQTFIQTQSPHFAPLHIVESTFFAKSHTSSMIQVADVCANIFYREMVHGGNPPEYRSLYQRFHRNAAGRVLGCGIKKWP